MTFAGIAKLRLNGDEEAVAWPGRAVEPTGIFRWRTCTSFSLPLRVAMEARDLPAIVNAFAMDAEFRSPLTERLTFRGREQIAALSSVLLDVFDHLRYTEELLCENTGFLVSRAQIDGQDIEMVDHMRFGLHGRIKELTVFFRPLPAAAAALRLIGAGLARRMGPARAALISTLAHPLVFMSRVGDGIGVRLVRSVL